MSKRSSQISLSIVVPVFNEEDGVEKTIVEILKDTKRDNIKRLIRAPEIIVVNDGSWDNTYRILQIMKKKYPQIKILTHKINQGLGASLMTGIKNSSREFVTYLPADGQVFLREISKGLKVADKADLVLTYRGQRIDYSSYRHLLSNTLTIAMKLLFRLNFRDYNWVHIYKRKLFKSIKIRSKGVFYLAEVVVRTKEKGFKILEAQAQYHPRSTGYSKNANPKIVIRTLIDLFKLWIELKLK